MSCTLKMPSTFLFYERLKSLSLNSEEVEAQLEYFNELKSRSDITSNELSDLLLIIFCFDKWHSKEMVSLFDNAIREIALFAKHLEVSNMKAKIVGGNYDGSN